MDYKMFKRKSTSPKIEEPILLDENGNIIPPVKKEKKKRIRLAKDDELYVSNADMMGELRKYHESGIISNELGNMFMKIAKRYTSAHNWANYTYREDFMSAGVCRMISQIDKFDMNRALPNPFAYFTEILYKEVLNYIAKEKKYTLAKKKYNAKYWTDVCQKEGISKRSGVEDEEDVFQDDEFDDDIFNDYINDEIMPEVEDEEDEDAKEKAKKEKKLADKSKKLKTDK